MLELLCGWTEADGLVGLEQELSLPVCTVPALAPI